MDDATLAAVLAVHTNFYTALSLADMALMQRIWLASPDAVCVHPGWAALTGWEAIRESWQGIFESQGLVRIWPTEVQVRLYGQTAEITCIENVDLTNVRGSGVRQTRATNILRHVEREWKFLEHHAVSLPGGQPQPREPFSTN
jgi:ketosteroid isomerase-like protein